MASVYMKPPRTFSVMVPFSELHLLIFHFRLVDVFLCNTNGVPVLRNTRTHQNTGTHWYLLGDTLFFVLFLLNKRFLGEYGPFIHSMSHFDHL